MFYGVRFLLWSLNPITMKILFELQMIRLTNRQQTTDQIEKSPRIKVMS